MKTFLLITLSALAVCIATADTPTPPAVYYSTTTSNTTEYFRRFVACESIGDGFFWLDTTNGDLWRLDESLMEWEYLGDPRGANSGPKGTYQLLPDRRGGVYILNTDTGEGWWTNGNDWKVIGRLSRLKDRDDD